MEYLEKLLDDLKSGKYKKEFDFSQPEDFEESQQFKDDILFTFNNDSISCQLEWTYYRTKGMKGDGYLTPDDSDDITLDYIGVENFIYTENDEEHQLEDLHRYPRLKKMFLLYIIDLMKSEMNGITKVDNGIFKYYLGESMKYIKNFESFKN